MAASKGPLNYTTVVPPGKSAAECIDILVKHGARKVGMSVGEDKMPDGIEFVIETAFGPRAYSLTVNAESCRKVLEQAWRDGFIDRRYKEPEQARRVAWRVMKDWLESQLALVEMGLRELPEVMLPYMKVDEQHSMYSAWAESEHRAIEAARGSRT